MIEELSLPLPLQEAAGSQVDLAAFVETYSTLLFRVAHSILRNSAEAEDVVQDTFLRVMEHRQSLPAVRDMRVWLVRIAWNLALDRRRRIRPEQMDPIFAQNLISAHLPADRVLSNAQQAEAVFRQIDRLPNLERQVLLLTAIEELDTAEMARLLHKSDSAIRALLFRARTRLRERLQKAGTA